MKSWAKPTHDDVARAVAALARPEQQRYFFDKLQNPEWIEPLRAKGFFATPPEPERNDQEGTIRFVPWPQSQYLARMAAEKPALVAEIFLALPDSSNISIHGDLVAAASSMPWREAKALADAEAKWIEKQEWLYGLYADQVAKLICHLLQMPEGHGSAIHLAKALFALKSSGGEFIPQVKAKFDNYTFGRVVNSIRRPMVEALGAAAVTLFADLLERAVHLETEGRDEDYSFIWRPAIEDHEQNELQGDEIPSVLVTVLRETAREAVRGAPANAEAIFQDLLRRRRSIFLRIAYYVAREQRYDGQALRQMLVDRESLHSTSLQRDYALLLETAYGLLPQADRERILEWIQAGPPPQEDEDAERARGRAAHWKSSRLHVIREHLSGSALAEYEALVREHGEPSAPDFPMQVSGGWVGPTSPILQEQLAEKTDEEIFQFLKDWRPAKGSWGPEPSRRGLARELEALMTEHPQRMWSLGSRLQTLDPTYVSALFMGLRAALGKNKSFDWKAPLELGKWVSAHPPQKEPADNNWDDGDQTWNSSKLAVTRLAGAGFRSTSNPIPAELRELAWKAFSPVTEDPDPTPAYEAQYGGTNMNPTMLAINSARGVAMEALIAYGLWVRRNLDQKQVSQSFASMPEVEAILNKHLDPAVDPSVGIRSVYGQWFPWLHLLDPAWAESNKSRFFPDPADSPVLWEVAFKTYLVHVRPFDSMLPVLRSEYERAVERLGKSDYVTRYAGDPDEHLAVHLVTFVVRGKLDMNDPLLERFYKVAPSGLRRHAINFLGRSLWGEQPPTPEVHDRMHQFWEKRLAHFMPPAGASADEELKAFGAWFAARQENPAWALQQLKQVLAIQPDIDLEFMVIKRLAALAAKFPSQTAEALYLLVSRAPELWKLTIEHDAVRAVLRVALDSGEPARRHALQTIELFGKAGFHHFRDMVS